MADLDGRCFISTGKALIPADFAAEEFLSEIPKGREVIVTVRRPRSPQHHRWFFAMLRKVVDNTEYWSDEEDLLDDLKDAVGHIRRGVNMLTGVPRRKTLSISFAAMGEDKFKRFRARCVDVLCRSLGWDPTDLMREVDETQRRNPNGPSIVPADETSEREPAEPEQLSANAKAIA